MHDQTSTKWLLKVKNAAELLALSSVVKAYFGLEGSPKQWESVITGWNENKLDDLMLIVQEEGLMLKDVDLETQRKLKVNGARLLQRLEKLQFTLA